MKVREIFYAEDALDIIKSSRREFLKSGLAKAIGIIYSAIKTRKSYTPTMEGQERSGEEYERYLDFLLNMGQTRSE